MYLLAPLILQNFKKTQNRSRVMRVCHFRSQNSQFVLNKKLFLEQKSVGLTVGPFHRVKFKKLFKTDPELWGCIIFGPKMVHLPQTIFFAKIINIIFIYLLNPYNVESFKKILPVDAEL